MIASRDFYEALGTLVYSLAAADGSLQTEELKRYGSSLLSSFGDWEMNTKGVRATAAFEMHQRLNTPADQAFEEAMDKFGYAKAEVKHYKTKIVTVLMQVAAANRDIHENEKLLIERFSASVDRL